MILQDLPVLFGLFFVHFAHFLVFKSTFCAGFPFSRGVENGLFQESDKSLLLKMSVGGQGLSYSPLSHNYKTYRVTQRI